MTYKSVIEKDESNDIGIYIVYLFLGALMAGCIYVGVTFMLIVENVMDTGEALGISSVFHQETKVEAYETNMSSISPLNEIIEKNE